MEHKENRYNVPALEKGLIILEKFAETDQPIGVADIHALVGLPKTSIFMILSTLENFQFIEKQKDGKYKLTMKMYNLSLEALSKIDVRSIAMPFMVELSDHLRFTVHLATLSNGMAVYIEKVNGPGFVQFSTKVGHSWPLNNSAVGKVLAGYLPEKELDQILEKYPLTRTTDHSIVSPDKFKEFLHSVRKTGYAIEDEEGEIGIRCIGAPIFDRYGEVIAAISITALRNELPSIRFHETGLIVREQALIISKNLGYVPSDSCDKIGI